MHHFWVQNGPHTLIFHFFFWKTINIILIYLLGPFIVQHFLKILPADPELVMHNFWAQNGPFLQNLMGGGGVGARLQSIHGGSMGGGLKCYQKIPVNELI